MFFDARGIADGSTLDCDVCIVGAGAAGITIARELAATRLRVLVLESGGLRGDPETQALYEGENVGHPYFALEGSRVRFFGGSTAHWSGWCQPLRDSDFEARAWVPHSGWPIRRADLDPFYERAHRVCELGPFDYRPGFWAAEAGARPLPLGSTGLANTMYHFSPPTRFGTAYRRELQRAGNVRILLHANATRLERERDAGRIGLVRVATLTGRRFVVRPASVVLAAGAIENARLMLISRVGDGHDLVGRFFAEHLHAVAGVVAFPEGSGVERFYTDYRTQTTHVRGAIGVSDRLQREEGLLGFSATFDPVETLRPAVREALGKRAAERAGADVARIASDVDGRRFRLYGAYMRTEQAPNPASRVTLGDQRDALGQPRVRLDWRIGELDRRSVERALEAFARGLGTAGLGRVHSAPAVNGSFWPTVEGGYHHMGTARMHRDPRRGVVDSDCRVHDTPNLYVAGSAVFTTYGVANPTMTIVALALRLADHLARTGR